MGPAYSSFITRNLVKGYVIMGISIILSFLTMGLLFDNVVDRIERVALSNCQAGNERSLVQAAQIRESVRQNESIDIGRLLGIEEAQVAEIREITRRNAQTRLSQLPYVDCETGERIPLPPP